MAVADAQDAGPLAMNDGVPLTGFEKLLLTDAAKTTLYVAAGRYRPTNI